MLLSAEAEQLLAAFLGCGVHSVCWPAAQAREQLASLVGGEAEDAPASFQVTPS
ncbi:hypothetical protein [Streptomyces abikoensis]|uniref:Uncharacterized protein n=1 Tax=Streptomyces abikoensis TaxID=97398 RepID=A0ABW7SY56_9ACTN